jgi:amphi-Trp domain-containing protein
MKYEQFLTLTKKELVQLLVNISGQIRAENKININGWEISLPEQVEVELEYKEKGKRSKFEIELRWPTTSMQPLVLVNERQSKFVASGESLKDIKKAMQVKLVTFEKDLKKNQLPSEAELKLFFNLTLAFQQKA